MNRTANPQHKTAHLISEKTLTHYSHAVIFVLKEINEQHWCFHARLEYFDALKQADRMRTFANNFFHSSHKGPSGCNRPSSVIRTNDAQCMSNARCLVPSNDGFYELFHGLLIYSVSVVLSKPHYLFFQVALMMLLIRSDTMDRPPHPAALPPNQSVTILPPISETSTRY